MIADVKGIADTVDEKTFDDYAAALQKLFVLEDIHGWCPSIRSASAMRSGAEHLLQIKKLIRDYNKSENQVPLREPDLLIVLTGGELAYTRKDGVKVIPIGCLKD